MRQSLSRRRFLGVTAGAAAAASGGSAAARELPDAGRMKDGSAPWFLRTRRWVQTNLNEQDPATYDAALWADYWARVRAQGVIVNAGGIVAFYPSRFEWHHRALALGDRDLFGEILAAARRAGLTVLARMDSTRTYEDVFRAHPDWFARDAKGEPFKGGDLYTVCVNGPWVNECVPAILREIAERYRPDGFTDNSWSGLGQRQVCYCDHCRAAFRRAGVARSARAGGLGRPGLPRLDPLELRAAHGDLGRVQPRRRTRRAGRTATGSGCARATRRGCARTSATRSAIWSRSPIVMLDWQARRTGEGFQTNAIAGKTVHGVLGWDKLVPESTALYLGPTRPMFRKAAKPEPEARLWAVCGMAAGIQPWWHHLGASQDDRRQLRTAERLSRWHAENEAYLVDRTPIATVGVVWSEANIDWYGRGESATRAVAPFAGMAEALGLHRILWRAVHADHVEARRAGAGRARPAEPRGDVGRAVRGGAAVRGGGRGARGDGRDEPLRRGGPAARRLRPGGSPRRPRHRASTAAPSNGPAASPWASWDGHSYLRLAAGATPPGGARGLRGDGHPALRRAGRGRAGGRRERRSRSRSCRTRRSRPPRTSGCASRGRRSPASSSKPSPAAGGSPTCPRTSTAASAATASPTTAG